MKYTKKVSVCIPTCNRPRLVKTAVNSALSQKVPPCEVVVGDDSDNKMTKNVIREYDKEQKIRYISNQPPLGQAGNVNRLLQASNGDFIVLLHDDDRLIEGSIEALLECFSAHSNVVATFGKHQIVNAEAEVNWEVTKRLNQGYYRTAEYEGLQSSSLRSAIVQQFPGAGYMVRADVAKHVGYDHPEAGDACDFAFGVELAKNTDGKFYFTDDYVYQYRQWEKSISHVGGDAAYRALRIVLEDLPAEALEDPLVEKWIRRKAPAGIMAAAQNGFVSRGLKWFFSQHHRHRIVTPGGVRRLIQLLYSYVTN